MNEIALLTSRSRAPATISAVPQTGLAHVATASFLASRAAPSGGFAVALAGGVALARVAERFGLRAGWGAAIAVMLQTVAIMGPSRFGIPLTQAISAPVLGRMEARGRGTVAQALAAAAIRIVHNTIGAAFAIFVLVGIDAYTGTYERLLGWVPFLPEGRTGALLATVISIVAWTGFASTVQAMVYRRGLTRWPADPEDAEQHPLLTATEPPAGARFDPRAVVVAAAVAFAVLLSGTEWLLLGSVALWLGLAWLTARGDRSVVRSGLALTAVLAGGALIAGVIGGIGLDETVRRTLRVALLVLVATWMRYAAGEAGLREVFRRALHRLRVVPSVPEASAILDGLGSTASLAESGRRLLARLRGVPAEPVPLTDAVLDWVAGEAGRHAASEAPQVPPTHLRARHRDALLVVLAAATVAAVPFAT